MTQPYAVWLREKMEACSDPFIRTTVMLPHAEDMAAMYRREMQQAESPGLKLYFQRTLAGFEDLIQQYAAAA
ncbi:hypothetical protein [Pseudomonas oryzihabitans]|uniref:hypothetical protein n=1 Tax=Pseudomonas oryzihabitans TaxID=47885 RepID=UPI001D9BAC8F|nr:hypothetical protein [Pseudomonas oryzihabitans]HJE71436.1 hypothetical protein [Pseudomonas oryzihabitans]